MDKEIVTILKKYGCAYMESDNKEMIEEIVNFAKEQGKALIIDGVSNRREQCEHRYAFLIPEGRGAMQCSDCGEEI